MIVHALSSYPARRSILRALTAVGAFGRPQSSVAGSPKNGVQFMVKDSRKYASTGGWGFAQFNDGKPADEAVHNTCFTCHEAVKARDFVFTRYAP